MFTGKVIFFRTDASFNIGTGHVMRCLTLAKELSLLGAQCQFISREHEGNIVKYIESSGFNCHLLPPVYSKKDSDAVGYALWLGCSQQQDASESQAIIDKYKPDWLIVDHYGLDIDWESRIKASVGKMMVIDDLADRKHQCDLLLDQNLGRSSQDYQTLIPAHCRQLYGPQFALLRPEFFQHREISLARRKTGKCESILITMGGIDKDNITLLILDALKHSNLPPGCHINVVMGAMAPGIAQVEKAAALMPCKTKVLVGVNDMARLMAESDLAIGAAGSTAWERCALGMPTIMVVIAENQYVIAKQLEEKGACLVIWKPEQINETVPALLTGLMTHKDTMLKLAQVCAEMTDGAGVRRVTEAMSNIDD